MENNKYNNGKIYKIEPICEYPEGDIYIGSTSEKLLSNRMGKHRCNYKRWLIGIEKTKCNAYDLFDKYGIENCKIILIEKVNATCKEELLSRESHYIRNMKCLNTVIPDRTAKEWHKEYYQNNKEKFQSIQKQYYQDNKEYIDNKNKEYKEKHKEAIEKYQEEYRNNLENKQRKKELESKPVTCECGCIITKNKLKRHQQSQRHIDLMEQL